MLELIHVEKKYKNKIVVDDLSFQINRGEIVGLIGPNGAGKSTTVSMIATLMRPDGGEILFDGENILQHPMIIKRNMGYVPQEVALYESLTGFDNLIFWANCYHLNAKQKEDRISYVSDLIGCNKEMLGRKVQTYSGGMKRKLNIAVALLHDPQLIVLDEPTVGIDVTSRKQIINVIQMLKQQGKSVLFIGHYLEEVEQLCDRIVVLNHGKCILNRTLEEALLDHGSFHSLEQLYEHLGM